MAYSVSCHLSGLLIVRLKSLTNILVSLVFTRREAGEQPLPEFRINVYMNHLKDQKEVLQWYVDMNAVGTPHTDDEIEKVWKMIRELE